MPSRLRLALTAVVASLALAAAGSTAPASAVPSVAVPSVATSSGAVLQACYNVRALSPNDRLFNGRFVLTAFPDYLQLEEDVTFPGELETAYVTLIWTRANPNPPTYATDRSYLALHCNGDLAFRRSNGTLLWHSNTANRGVTRLVLTSGGNLNLLDASGRLVWQSGTGRSTLPANSVLPSNSKLTSDRNVGVDGKRDSLSMQTDGNLVYRRGSSVYWQSDTHVPGSHAALSTRGQLLVVTPGGRFVFASHPLGSRRTVLDIGMSCVCDLENHLLPVWGFSG